VRWSVAVLGMVGAFFVGLAFGMDGFQWWVLPSGALLGYALGEPQRNHEKPLPKWNGNPPNLPESEFGRIYVDEERDP
jgi:hypothetical protein